VRIWGLPPQCIVCEG